LKSINKIIVEREKRGGRRGDVMITKYKSIPMEIL
jgi:hypothetical protein